jgi:hypothetical protein
MVGLVCTVAGVLAGAGASSAPDNSSFDPSHTVRFDIGDLTLVVGDHYEHEGSGRENYTGIHHLSHRLRPSNVFCPLYAGMIGVRRPCRVEQTAPDTARIVVGDGDAQIIETFRVVPPHYIDYSAEFTARATTGFWNNTSYTNGPADPGIYVRASGGTWVRHYSPRHGHGASVAPVGMDPLPPVTPSENPKYPHGSDQFHQGFSALRYDPRFPLYYGRFDDMVLVFMMERDRGPMFIPYMSPTGGGYSEEFDRPNPAWDHRFHLDGLTPGERVVIRQRVCYKRHVNDADVVDEYERWLAELEQ